MRRVRYFGDGALQAVSLGTDLRLDYVNYLSIPLSLGVSCGPSSWPCHHLRSGGHVGSP